MTWYLPSSHSPPIVKTFIFQGQELVEAGEKLKYADETVCQTGIEILKLKETIADGEARTRLQVRFYDFLGSCVFCLDDHRGSDSLIQKKFDRSVTFFDLHSIVCQQMASSLWYLISGC